MLKPIIIATIVEVKAIAESDGVVYDQEVTLKLKNDFELVVYDHDLLCTYYTEGVGYKTAKEFEGTKKKVYLYVIGFDVKKTILKKKGAVQTRPIPDPHYFSFHGEVLEVTQDDKLRHGSLILDIGVGTIKVGLKRADHEYEKFTVGDYVEVSGGWIELEEIIGEDKK